MTTAAETTHADAPRKGRRWLKVLVVLFVLLVVAIAFAPMLLSPFVADRVASELTARTGGKAEVGEVQLGWSAARVSGVTLDDPEGQRLLAVRGVDASYDLLGVVSGRLAASVAADGVELHVRQADDGRLNLDRLVESLAGGGDGGGSGGGGRDDGAPSNDDELPQLRADVKATDVNVVVHAPDTGETTEIRGASFTLDVDGLDAPAPFDVELLLAGPGQADGARVRAGGAVTARDTDGEPSARIGFDVEPQSLGAFAPVLALLGVDVDVPRGSLRADGKWTWNGGLEIEGRSSLSLADASVDVDGQTLSLPFTTVALVAGVEDSGSAAQTLTVEAGDLLHVDVDAGYAAGEQRVTGSAQARGLLAEALARTSPWVTLKDGVAVDGRWAVDGSWDVAVDEAYAPRSLVASLVADLSELSATTDGAPLDLGELTALRAELSATAPEGLATLDVPTLSLHAGPVTLDGTLSLAGLKSDVPTLRDSDVSFAADLGRLTELVGRVVDLGALSLGGTLDGSLTARTNAEGRVDVAGDQRVAGLVIDGVGDGPRIDLDELRVEQRAHVTPDGAVTIERAGLSSRFVDVTTSGTIAPVDGADVPALDLTTQWSLALREIPASLTARLPVGVDGGDLTGDLALATGADGLRVDGRVAHPAALTITVPPSDDGTTPARTIRTAAVDAGWVALIDPDGPEPRITLTSLDARTSTGTLGATGTVQLAGDDAPAPVASVDLDLELSAPLDAVWRDLADFVAPKGGSASGAGRWDVDVTTSDGVEWLIEGLGGVDALALTLPLEATTPGDPTQLVLAPRDVHTNWATRIFTDELDVHFPMLSAGWDGLHVDGIGSLLNLGALGDPAADPPARIDFSESSLGVEYVPDLVQRDFGALLPVTLRGTERRRASFYAHGPLRLVEGDPLATLADLTVDADVDVGTLELPFVSVDGDLRADVVDGALDFGSDFDVNGGTLNASLAGPLRDVAAFMVGEATSGATTLSLGWNDVGADAKIGAALDQVHPLLASFGAGADAGPSAAGAASFASKLAGRIDLTYAGALVPHALAKSIDLTSFSGSGNISLGETTLGASPLLSDMLGNLGATDTRRFEIAPLEFSIDRGRLSYDEPWEWTMGGIATSFTGSVAPDGLLDLRWNLPITAALVDKHSFLEVLEGEAIAVPLVGSLTAPRLAFDGVLSDLADRALKRELEDRVDEALPGLDLGIPGLPGGNREDREDPAELLAEADRLWDAGEQEAAREIYERLEDDFKYSLVVLTNKDRIEDRAEKPKKPKDGTKKGAKKKKKKKKKDDDDGAADDPPRVKIGGGGGG